MSFLLIAFLLTGTVVIIASLALKFRGPYFLHKIFPGCSVKSVSLRSIRGIRITHGQHVVEIDRVGLSLGRQPGTSSWSSFHCSIRTSNVTIRAFEGYGDISPVLPNKPLISQDPQPLRSRRSRFSIQTFSMFMNPANDTVAPPLTILKRIAPSLARSIDHLLRPVFRILFVATFRLFIRFLPALVRAVDFELDRATLTIPLARDLTFLVEQVRVSTEVEFSQLERVIDDSVAEDAEMSTLRRLSRMGNWRLRLKGSWERTWNRAWGRTHVFSGVSVQVGHVEGSVRPILAPTGSGVSTVAVPELVSVFRLDGASWLKGSVRFIPRRATFEGQSLSLSASLGALLVDLDNMIASARSVAEVLAPKHGPPTEVSPFDRVDNQGTFSPPMSPTFDTRPNLNRRRFRERARKRGTLSIVEVFKGLDVRLPKFECITNSSVEESAPKTRLSFSVIDTFFKCEVSHPESHPLHRKWLGISVSRERGEAFVAQAGFGATALGWTTSTGNASIPLLTLDRFLLSALGTSWAESSRLDPNDSLVAVEVELEPLIVSGTAKDLQALERIAHALSPPQSQSSARTQYPITQVPRFAVDIRSGGLNILYCLDNHGPQSSSLAGLHLRIPQLELHGHSEFIHRSWARRDQAREAYTESMLLVDAPYLLRFEATGFVGPIDAQIIFEDRVSTPLTNRHSVLRFAQIELEADGELLAAMFDGAKFGMVDNTTLIARTRTIADTLVLDLTCAEALSTLVDLFPVRPPVTVPAVDAAPKQPLLSSIPSGIDAHLAIGTISCLASGRDFAPSNTKPVKRGIELRIGLAVGYCLMHDRLHSHRTRGERFASTQHRDRLQLQGDILSEAISVSQQLNEAADEKGAVLRLDAFAFQIRPIVDFGEAFIPLCGWETASATSAPALVFHIPRMRADVLLKRTTASQSTPHDICRVVVDIRRVRANLSIHHAYCFALASTALPRAQPKTPVPQPQSSPSHGMLVHVTGQINNLQIKADLPGTQRAYISLEKLKIVSRDERHEVSLGNLHGWVLAADGKWDELLRMRHLEVTTPHADSRAIGIAAQAARLRIPHEYSLASLIQEISLAAKTTKHLFHIIKADHFVAMGTPEAEDAKQVPPLSITVGSLVVEAADDPLESRLALIWKAGLKEQQERLLRQDAFNAKVEAIQTQAVDDPEPIPQTNGLQDWHFGSKHTVSVEEARQRLHQFDSSAWISSFNTAKGACARREETQLRRLGQTLGSLHLEAAVPLDIRVVDSVPPLIRLIFDGVRVDITKMMPTTSNFSLPEFLKRTGGLPLDTQYTLLVPLGIRWEMRSAAATLRDYPLPLLQVYPNADESPAWTASTDLVIAEELGPSDSVEWLPTVVVPAGLGLHSQPGFSLLVPKTGMPVKTYANPVVRVASPYATIISWGVSYQPCVADVMRILESLTHPSRDPSKPLGFWDKIRMSLHGKLRISFTGDLNLVVKGSRDPYEISGTGAGFALCWSGNPEIFVGYHLEEKELIQFRGDKMLLGIPNLQGFAESRVSEMESPPSPSLTAHPIAALAQGNRQYRLQKICAKLTNGVKFGLGFALERNCGPDCTNKHASGPCRRFDFRPHYQIQLRPSTGDPKIDSFAGFRSDFIHFSLSLISPTNDRPRDNRHNSFHLSPKAFAHFFSWWDLFNPPNGPMLLPIRQGTLYPSDKPPPVKFTRHLATLKYRFSLSPLFISHNYRQDSRTSWATGITPCVGFKAVVESFQADLHQRDQVESIQDEATGLVRTKTHKPFSAAEVLAKGLDLRAMLAHFNEPEKPGVDLPPLPNSEFDASSSTRPPMPDSSKEPLSSRWVDMDDFVELDWSPNDKEPDIWLFTAALCPHIMYFKKPDRPQTSDVAHTSCSGVETTVSRFGNEDTHICVMNTELSAIQVQAKLCLERLQVLEKELSAAEEARSSTITPQDNAGDVLPSREESLEKKIGLLREHLDNLERTELHLAQRNMPDAPRVSNSSLSYSYPTESEVDVDWSQFDNIYQIHCPQVHLNNYTRNILLDYYYSSRNRRGFEYHLSERAVRFIREQSPVTTPNLPRSSQESKDGPTPLNRAQAAAHTIRKIFTADGSARESASMETPQPIKCQPKGEVEPASGWKTDDIVVNKSHLCLLLNPQFTLRSTADAESILVITAAKASLQTFAILDRNYVDGLTSDPINAYIMKRNYGSLSGLQVFSPSRARDRTSNTTSNEVPLEVLLDLRCESNDFDRLVPQTEAALQYDKFNRLRLRNKVACATVTSTKEDTNDHLHTQNDRVVLTLDQLAVSANAQNFAAIYNIVSDLILYTDPDQRERNRQLQMFMYAYDFRDFMESARVVSELQQRLRSLLATETQMASKGAQLTEDRLMTRAHIFLLAEELNLIFKAIRLVQEQDESASDENKSNMRFDATANEISWKMLEDTSDTLAKLSVRGIEYAWHNQKDSSAANKLVIKDLQALDSSPEAVFPEMLVKYDKASSHPMYSKSLFAQAEWSVLAPVGGIPIVNSFSLDLHPIRLQIERKVGRKIMAYIFPSRNVPVEPAAKPPSATTPRSSGMSTRGHKTQSSIGAGIGAGLEMGLGIAGIPRASLDNTSLESASARPRTLKKRATSHSSLKEAAAASNAGSSDMGTVRHRGLPKSRSSHALRADAKASAMSTSSKAASRAVLLRPGTADKEKEKEKEKEPETKDDANEMRVRASKNRTFVLVRVAGLVFVLSYKRDTPMSLTTVPDLDDFRFETPMFSYQNETWSFEDMVEVLKKDIYKAAWAQKGALLREVFTKAKIITPKRFLPQESRLAWTHRRPRGKTIKPATVDNGKGKEQGPSVEHSSDNLVDSMISSDSGLALSHHTDFSSSSHSTFSRSQRPTTQTSLSDSTPIGFPRDDEPSPTARSLASSRTSGSSQTFPRTSNEPEGSVSAPAFAFPTSASPPPMSIHEGGVTRHTRERVLSFFKKGKKKDLDAPLDAMPRQSLDIPDVPRMPGTRQRTISAHAKMQK